MGPRHSVLSQIVARAPAVSQRRPSLRPFLGPLEFPVFRSQKIKEQAITDLTAEIMALAAPTDHAKPVPFQDPDGYCIVVYRPGVDRLKAKIREAFSQHF